MKCEKRGSFENKNYKETIANTQEEIAEILDTRNDKRRHGEFTTYVVYRKQKKNVKKRGRKRASIVRRQRVVKSHVRTSRDITDKRRDKISKLLLLIQIGGAVLHVR